MPTKKVKIALAVRPKRKNVVVVQPAKQKRKRKTATPRLPMSRLSPKGQEYFRCAVLGTGAPAQIPDGSATPSLPCRFQYCFVVRPNAAGEIVFAITPNIVGNFAINKGKISGFPIYNAISGDWETISYDSDTTLINSIMSVGDQVYTTATFPDLQAGNPLTPGQNDAFYRVQSWRCVDSCAKITYRGAPLYASGTAQVVRQSITVDRVSGATTQGLNQPYNASADTLAGTTITGGAVYYNASSVGIYGTPLIPGGIRSTRDTVGDLRIQLSSNGPTNSAQVCSLVGADSFPANKTLHAKTALQDTNYQPYIEQATAVVADNAGRAGPCWGQLIKTNVSVNNVTTDADSYIPTTLPGYGHGDTTFFVYSGLPTGLTEGALFVECEACFEVTLGRNSSVGRLAQPAPAKDGLALDVVSDIQKKMPPASTTGSWVSDAFGWYTDTMKKSIGWSWNIGAQVAKAAGFSGPGDIAEAVAKMMINDRGGRKAIRY